MIISRVLRMGASVKMMEADIMIEAAVKSIAQEIPPQHHISHIELSQVAYGDYHANIQVIILVRTAPQ